MIAFSIHVDYRPVMEEAYALVLVLPEPNGGVRHAHDAFAESLRAGRHAVLVDVQGQEWTFEPGTVRAFWTRSFSEA